MKQSFVDINLLKVEWNIFSVIATITGFILAITGVPEKFKIAILIISLIIFAIIYVTIFVYYKFLCKNLKIKIGKVDLNIKVGNIFNEEGLKVIPVNEYFDTLVDDVVISNNSLHGLYVKDYQKYNNLESLDREINNKLSNFSPYEINTKRILGKQKKYNIGTTIVINDFILTALTKFNDNNEAYLSMQDYLIFLNKFWNEINRIHNGRIINVPIIGTGISRINPVLTEQEYLEQIIWSLKTSALITSKSRVNIIVYNLDKDKISLLRLKKIFKTMKM